VAEITQLTIREAGALLARRELSAVALVEATLRRIEETEPLIHAYTLVLAEQARDAARQVDREIARGEHRGPLHGIPIGVKDLCYTAGIRTEAGSRAWAGFIPSYDAAVVERLRDAGAIMIGKTVTHELAYGVNEPPTRNPWRADYYPGRSSAGSGAAVAARTAFGAIGTDTGGSIREPASLNGVVGIKPTFGLVSRYGIVPLSPSLDHAGPIARTVEDCALLLQGIAGYDPRDSGSVEAPAADYLAALEGSIAGLTIGVERRYFFGSHVWDDVRTAVDGVLAELAERGARIVEVEMPALELMSPVGTGILLPEASAYHRRTLRERAADLDPATRRMLELGELIPATQYVTAQRVRTTLRDGMRALFEAHHLDAMLSPTVPTTSVPMDQVSGAEDADEDPMASSLLQMIPANVTGQPALTVPCGFSSSGLPIGFQLLGRPFAEGTLFRLARAYEANHDHAAVIPALP
jgi:aspartyl-tRNA(Asn)/glutamyl-tRNA(Gln) amidotransferase subunit A